jgi:hypothetical protein
MPIDTLGVLPVPALPGLEFPRTLQFGPDGTLWVADSGAHRLFWLSPEGDAGSVPLDSLRYPYLAGFRSGLPVVFSPAAARLAAIDVATVGDNGTPRIAWSVATEPDLPPRVLQYAAVTDSTVWLKYAADDFEGRLLQLSPLGSEVRRVPLPDPFWRWAGALRMWDGQPLSLSGYRPQVYRPSADGGMDSTALLGFDSPMLPRSRQFLAGETSQPPLLSPSAAPYEDGLLVLNIRAGWLRVDAYGRDLKLRRSLVEPNPAFGQEFYPTDLTATRRPDGTRILAVAVTKPNPEVRMYTIPASF